MTISVVRGDNSLEAVLRRAGLAALGLLLMGAAPEQAQAQMSISPHVGMTVAGGNFGGYTENSYSGSLRIAQTVMPRTSVFVEGGMDRFDSRELMDQPEEYAIVFGPDMQILRFAAGLERELIPEDIDSYSTWSARLRVGGGVEMIEADDFQVVGEDATRSFSQTAPLVTSGLSVGYVLSSALTLFVDGGVYWAPVNEEDTEGLALLAPFYVKSFSSAFTFPYSVGVRLTF